MYTILMLHLLNGLTTDSRNVPAFFIQRESQKVSKVDPYSHFRHCQLYHTIIFVHEKLK